MGLRLQWPKEKLKLESQKIFLDFKAIKQFECAFRIVQVLQKLGFEAVFAGGSVRDILNQRADIENIDIDIATNAAPDVVEKTFERTIPVGKSFGVIRVLMDNHSLEVATYRTEGPYIDGRRPENVQFTSQKEDALRRDFTVNALFYDPIKEELTDDVGGLQDLKDQILKAVGNPFDRFQEDELRRLRLIRFVSQLGFKVDPLTWQAIKGHTAGLSKLSRERITEEIFKLWKGRHLKMAFTFFKDSEIAETLDAQWKNSPQLADDVWNLKRQTDLQIWWHYFFCLNQFQDLKSSFQCLKLSNLIEKSVSQVASVYQQGPGFLKLSFAQQRILVSSDEAWWALDAFFLSSPQWLEVKKPLKQAPVLPKPWLNGDDLLPYLKGPEIKKALRDLYLQQVEQNWTNHEQALIALQIYLKNK